MNNDRAGDSISVETPTPVLPRIKGGVSTHLDERKFTAGEAVGNIELVHKVEEAEHNERSIRYKSVMYLTIGLGVSLIGNILMIHGFSGMPKKVPIAMSAQGANAICQIPLLDRPFIGTPTVQAFAVEAITELSSFDSMNWKTQINNASAKYLTDEFRNQYLKVFENSTFVKEILAVGGIAQMQPAGRVQLLAAGVGASGSYEWEVSIPIDLYVKAGQKAQPRIAYATTMRIKQITPNPSNYRGVAVDSISIGARVDQK